MCGANRCSDLKNRAFCLCLGAVVGQVWPTQAWPVLGHSLAVLAKAARIEWLLAPPLFSPFIVFVV